MNAYHRIEVRLYRERGAGGTFGTARPGQSTWGGLEGITTGGGVEHRLAGRDAHLAIPDVELEALQVTRSRRLAPRVRLTGPAAPTHRVMTLVEFLGRLAILVPPPSPRALPRRLRRALGRVPATRRVRC